MENTQKYMRHAIEVAKKAPLQDEIPVGAIIVDPQTGEIISEAHNLSEHGDCVCNHAEILAIQNACRKLGVNRLRGMDLYVTLEPCTMCCAAISFARIRKLFFGATDAKGGAVVSGVQFYNSPTCHHKPLVEGGILEEECGKLLKDFFKNKRDKKD